jgi:hypothetical protein
MGFATAKRFGREGVDQRVHNGPSKGPWIWITRLAPFGMRALTQRLLKSIRGGRTYIDKSAPTAERLGIAETSGYERGGLREDQEFILYRARANARELPSVLLLILASIRPGLKSIGPFRVCGAL